MSETKSTAKSETWYKQLANGNIKTNTAKVLKHISDFPYIDLYHIRVNLGMAHQTVTSRISVLMDEGVIRIVGTVQVKGTLYSQYRVVPQLDWVERSRLKDQRHNEKYIGWIRQGVKDFGDKLPPELVDVFKLRLAKENINK